MTVNSLMKCIVFCFVTGSSKYSNLYWRYNKGQSGVTTSHVLRLQWLLCEMVQEEIYLEEERVSGWLRSGTGRTMIGRSEDGLLQEITWLQLKVDGDTRQRQTFAAGSTAAWGIYADGHGRRGPALASDGQCLCHSPAWTSKQWDTEVEKQFFPFSQPQYSFPESEAADHTHLVAPMDGSVTEAHSHLNWPSSVMTGPGMFSLLTYSLVRIRDKGYHKWQ